MRLTRAAAAGSACSKIAGHRSRRPAFRHRILDPLDCADADAEIGCDFADAAVTLLQGRRDAAFGLAVEARPGPTLALARARARPALTRSRIMARSNSAKTPII